VDTSVSPDEQGRVIIPVEVQAALGLTPGVRLQLHLAGDRIILQRQEDAVAELRTLAAAVPASRSLVDELLDERRAAIRD
jgi:antitoxin PrlF